jgi:hypothetical protein
MNTLAGSPNDHKINLAHQPTRLLLEELRPLVAEQQAAMAERDALKAAEERADQRCWQITRRINHLIRAIAEINDAVQFTSYDHHYDVEATGKLIDAALAQLAATGEEAAA